MMEVVLLLMKVNLEFNILEDSCKKRVFLMKTSSKEIHRFPPKHLKWDADCYGVIKVITITFFFCSILSYFISGGIICVLYVTSIVHTNMREVAISTERLGEPAG